MMGTPPTIDNIIHSQGSFSPILYKSYIVTHAIMQSIAFELCLGRTISFMLKLNTRGGVAIRMSWYAFFEKKLVGGDVYSGLESNQLYNKSIVNFRKQETSPNKC